MVVVCWGERKRLCREEDGERERLCKKDDGERERQYKEEDVVKSVRG